MLDVFLNWFVIAIPFLVTVGATVLTLKLPHERHYWKFVGAAIVVGLGFSGITYWQQIRTAKEAVADRDRAIGDTADRVAKKTTDNVTEAIGKQYKTIIDDVNEQNGQLRSQLEEQGKKVDKISNSAIVSGKRPLKVEVTNQPTANGETKPEIHASSMEATAKPEFGKYATQAILTTTKRMSGAELDIRCKHKINRASASVSGSGMMMGGATMGDDNTVHVGISFPDWSPDHPLVVILYHDAPQIVECTIIPHY